jgi:hypothetical protein
MRKTDLDERLAVRDVAEPFVERDGLGAGVEVDVHDATTAELGFERFDETAAEARSLRRGVDRHLEEATRRGGLGMEEDAADHPAVALGDEVETVLLERERHLGARHPERLPEDAKAQLALARDGGIVGEEKAEARGGRHQVPSMRRNVASTGL